MINPFHFFKKKHKIPNETEIVKKALEDHLNKIDEKETRNALIRAKLRLEELENQGTPIRAYEPKQEQIDLNHLAFEYKPNQDGYMECQAVMTSQVFEQDNVFGYIPDWWTSTEPSVGVNSFPREMFQDRPTTLRTQIAMDAVRLQSRIWYETSPQYNGIIGHLKHFILGNGLDVKVTCEDKEKEDLAKQTQEYLDMFATYENNNLHKRVYDTVINYHVDGEDAVQLTPTKDCVRIETIDCSTIRGPNMESTGPWSFGILTDYPKHWDDNKAYCVWYSDNTHEIHNPKLFKFLKNEESRANNKRGIPLAYKIRKQIPQLMKLSDAIAVGEASRQGIPYVVTHELESKNTVMANINTMFPRNQSQYNYLYPKKDIIPGEVQDWGPGKQFIDVPSGNAEAGKAAYRMLCEETAGACNVPVWFVCGSADSENFASSLVSESPVVRMIQHKQRVFIDYFEEILESVIQIAVAYGQLPTEALDLCVECTLPNPVPRNKKEDILIDLQLVDYKVLSPQHLCARNNIDFDEERSLIEQAEAQGWEQPELNQNDNNETDEPKDI